MRHHSTSIVGPDIDGEVTKEGMIAAMEDASKLVASWPQWKREVLHDSPPAQPSVGDRLAEVAFETMFQEESLSYNDQSPSRKRDWLNVALAVRREVLREGFVEGDVEAAAVAIANASNASNTRRLLPAWDDAKQQTRDEVREMAEAALSAALASRAERAEREGKQ